MAPHIFSAKINKDVTIWNKEIETKLMEGNSRHFARLKQTKQDEGMLY